MNSGVFRRVSVFFVASAILLSMLTSCSSEHDEMPFSVVNVSTITSSETTVATTSSIPDKVVATGIEAVTVDTNVKQIKVFLDEREIDGMLYLPEGTGPFPVCFIVQGLAAPCDGYIDIAEAMAVNGIAACLIDFEAENGEYSYETEAVDLMAMFDGVTSLPYIYCRNTFFWGHSYGGLVVTYAGCQYYSYFPEKFKGLILAEPSFDHSKDIYDKMPAFGGKVYMLAGDAQGSIGRENPDSLSMAQEAFSDVEFHIVEGENHYFNGAHRDFMIQMSIDFIKKNMEQN